MADSEIKDLIWHHSYGAEGVKHLKENEFFEKKVTRIDFSKGIAWILLTSFESYQQKHENGSESLL
ncbi:MAG TPA: hypothetical protein PKC25_13505 [Candidatus Rifleibacterium sp.]|nr:hypothetical protein [Candidatus Rifleibacterium sp.]